MNPSDIQKLKAAITITPRADSPKPIQTYYQQLKSSEWIEKSVELKKAADWKCEICARPQGEVSLQVHHTYYYRKMMLWQYPRCLLMVLCDTCHIQRQELEERIYINVADRLRDLTNEELIHQPIYALVTQE